MTRLYRDGTDDDLLSDLLRMVGLRGAGAVQMAPPRRFAIEFAPAGAMVHIFERGDCRLHVDGIEEPFAMAPGDVALIPRPIRHVIASGTAKGARSPRREDLAGPEASASTARWFSGSYLLDAPRGGHLLDGLPVPLVLDGGGEQLPAGLDYPRRQLLQEIGSTIPGARIMVSRILDLLFIQVVRAWARGPAADPNWMTGAMDPQIGQVLTGIHADPGGDWTVAKLARLAHMSRSAFAQRFVRRVGRTPAAYVAELRLEVAADRLRTTDEPINLLAEAVGYRSAAAFSRAFVQRFGVPPRAWRSAGRESEPDIQSRS